MTWQIIESIFYVIKWKHQISSEQDPCKTTLCKNLLESAKRICKRRKIKKEPLQIEHVTRLYDHYNKNEISLFNLRTFTLVIIGFIGFLRFDELSDLKLGDVNFFPSYMKILIRKSKTDVYRDGDCVYIAKSKSEICPVEILRLYIKKASIQDPNEYLFRSLTYFKSKDEHKLRKPNKQIYTTARSVVLDALEKIGLNSSEFGSHSLRSGGDTIAANNDVNDRLFKRHGRWKSESAKDGYVKDDLRNLLSVSRASEF